MRTKKSKWAALALVAALMLSSVSPATAYAGAKNYTVTADAVDANNVATIADVKADNLVIPGDLGASKVIMKNVEATTVVVEDGAFCDMEISGGSIGKLEIKEQKAKELTLRDMAKMIADGMKKSDAQVAYQEAKQERTPVIVIKDKAKVAKLKVTGSNLTLGVDGFTGALEVDQKAMGKGEKGAVQVELKNSKPSSANVTGDSQGMVVLTGTKAEIAEAVIGGSVNVVLDVETKKLETAKSSEGVTIEVLAPVEEVEINGKETELAIAKGVVVKQAVINAEGTSVAGEGKLEAAIVCVDSAAIETEGTVVSDPTPIPTKAPTYAPVYNGGYGGGSSSGGSSSGGSSGGSSSSGSSSSKTDADYTGDYSAGATIPASKFAGMTGEATIKFTYRKLQNTSYTYYQFIPVENVEGWPKLVTEDFSYLQYQINQYDFIDVPGSGTTVVMTLTADKVQEIIANDAGLILQVYGIIIEDVTVTEGEREENPDEGYAGDWGTGYSFTAATFAKLSGDVTITLNYRMVTTATDYQIAVYEPITGWPKLDANDFVSTEYEIDPTYTVMKLPADSTTTTMVIKAATVEEIKTNGAGLGIQVCGVIIESAAIQDANGNTGDDDTTDDTTGDDTTGGGNEETETTYSVDTNYADATLVRPFYLAKFTGDITVTAEFERIGSGYSQIKPATTWSTGMYDSSSGTNYFVDLDEETTGLPYYLNEWGYLYVTDSTVNEISFVISEAGVAKLSEQGGLIFQEEADGIKVTSVTLSGAQAEAKGYMGDDASACTFSKTEFSAGAADITIDYSLVEGKTWGQIQLFVVGSDYGWTAITSDDLVDLEYDINEYNQITFPGHLSELTLTLKEDVVAAAMAGNGVAIKINNSIILDKVAVDVAETDAESGTGNSGESGEDSGNENVTTVTRKTYEVSSLDVSGWGYSVDETSGVVTFETQYKEIQYTLPNILNISDYESVTVNIASASGSALAIKVYDSDGNAVIESYGGYTGTATVFLSGVADQTVTIGKIAIMAQDLVANSTVEPISIVFEPKGTYTFTGVKPGGYGYNITDGVYTYTGQYQEIQYELPNALTAGDYSKVVVNMSDIVGSVGVKVYVDGNSSAAAETYTIESGTATIDLSSLDASASIVKIGIMATTDVTSVKPINIVFTK